MIKRTKEAAPDAVALSVDQAARRAGIGRTKLYELMGDGALPFAQIGARRLILVDDLNSLLRENRRAA